MWLKGGPVMKCAEARELLSAYLDRTLSTSECAELEEHLRLCPVCAQELAELQQTVALIASLPEVEPPADFRRQLRQRLQSLSAAERAGTSPRSRRLRLSLTWLPTRAIAAVLVGLLVFAGGYGTGYLRNRNLTNTRADLGATGGGPAPGLTADSGAKSFGATASEPGAGTLTEGNTNSRAGALKQADQTADQTAGALTDGHKIVRQGELRLKVHDLRRTERTIVDQVKKYQGYVENSSFSEEEEGQPAAYLTLRVPVAALDELMVAVRALGEVQVENTSAVDVTLQYTDANARVENLKVQEERLRQLLTKAANVDDTLRIENELNRLRTEIDSTTSWLRTLSADVEYATLSVSLTQDPEAIAVSPGQSLFSRFRGAFLNTLRAGGRLSIAGVVALGAALPVLIVIGLLILIIRPQRWLKRRGRTQ